MNTKALHRTVSIWYISTVLLYYQTSIAQTNIQNSSPQVLFPKAQTSTITDNQNSNPTQGPNKNSSLTSDAINLYKVRKYREITQLLWKNLDKLSRTDFIVLAKSHEKLNQPKDMVKVLNMLIAKNDKDAEAISLLGNANLLENKQNEAIDQYRQALEINPKYLPAYEELIKIYEERKNLYELRLIFQDMIKFIGDKAEYISELCRINYQDGIYEPAVKECNSAIQKNKMIPDNYVYLGLSYINMGNEDKGVKYLNAAAKKFKKTELVQYSYANYLMEHKDFLQAKNYFKLATEADIKSVRSWSGLANSLFELKQYQESYISFQRLCSLDRQKVSELRKVANILRNSKDPWSGKFDQLADRCGLN